MKIIRLNSIIGLNTAALAAAIFILLTSQAAAKPRWEKAKQHWAFQKVKPPTIPSRQVLFNGKLRNWISTVGLVINPMAMWRLWPRVKKLI